MRTYSGTILLGLILCVLSKPLSAQVKNQALRGFPVVFYTEETSFAVGGLGIFTFDFENNLDSGKPSQINFGAAYTLEKQLLLYFPYELYLQQNNWRLDGEIGYYRYTYKYYGIGSNTPESNEETYRVNFPRVQINALRKVSRNIYAGVSYWYDRYDITNIQPGGLLDTNNPTGTSGGAHSGLGIASIYDTRDNIFYSTSGSYLELQGLIDQSWTGSDYDFFQLSLDARTFHTNAYDHTLGFNFVSKFTGGNVPFQKLALLGGPKQMRGYLEGRYRDKVYLTTQAEYRVPVYKSFGAVIFSSVGNVAQNLSDFPLTNLEWTLGPGLRYMIDENRKVNIRLDAGFGPGVSGFVLTIGEAF
ncbi:BamA/TamA family outer membrane protein [Gracilimonas sp.]|uniref:BamA/TamA family outer membrane protein n=1 Tax=Gracilimonas sp. TaxID=1974203 RepID=UPI003D0B2ADB